VPAELLGSSTDDLGARLRASAPAAEPGRLTHGDWRLGNTLCVEGEIRAVIDWEIWAVADPRTDLAWFLTNCDPSHPIAVAGPETGMPPIDGLVAEYERALDRRVSDLDWFRALAVYKQAATTALLAKNAAKRGRPMEQVTGRMTRRLPEMFHWAGAFLAGDTTG
jgi:aminoglycoside phosphotransferase (APT) family kinase protein